MKTEQQIKDRITYYENKVYEYEPGNPQMVRVCHARIAQLRWVLKGQEGEE